MLVTARRCPLGAQDRVPPAAGTTAHGITSSDYGAYDSAFAFAQRPPPSPPTQPTWLCETQGREYASEAEPVVAMQCPAGCLSEPRDVWGTGVYTSNSPVCKAAIHAGLITNTSSGLVTIYWDTGKASYTGGRAGRREGRREAGGETGCL